MTLSPINDISSKAFDELFSRFNGLDTDKLLVYLIDTVDASALPHLAEQFHVTGNEGWLLAAGKAGQRQLTLIIIAKKNKLRYYSHSLL